MFCYTRILSATEKTKVLCAEGKCSWRAFCSICLLKTTQAISQLSLLSISNTHKLLKETQKSQTPYPRAKPQQRKCNAAVEKRLEGRGNNRKTAKKSKQLFFFLQGWDGALQVLVTAVMQCLARSDSTLTVKEIQCNSSVTLRKNTYKPLFLKAITSWAFGKCWHFISKPKTNKQKKIDRWGDAYKKATATFPSAIWLGIKPDKA